MSSSYRSVKVPNSPFLNWLSNDIMNLSELEPRRADNMMPRNPLIILLFRTCHPPSATLRSCLRSNYQSQKLAHRPLTQ